MKRILHTLVLLVMGELALAQDPNFSQFFASPLTLNPASTGNFDGRLRVAGNYRSRFVGVSTNFTTATLSCDGRVSLKLLPEGDRLSVGAIMLSDQSGNGILKQNHVGFSLAYGKALDVDGNHYLFAGFQGVFSDLRFDASQANFEDELSPAGFTLPSADPVLTVRPGNSYFDLNTGIVYQASFRESNLFYIGTSLYHLNRPVVFTHDPDNYLRKRITIHSGFYQEINESVTVHAALQVQRQLRFQEWIWGGAVSKLIIDKPTDYLEVYAGLWLRNKDALIPYAGIDWKNIRAGLTFDVLLPGRRTVARSYQSNEFSLIWRLPYSSRKSGIKCPVF